MHRKTEIEEENF